MLTSDVRSQLRTIISSTALSDNRMEDFWKTSFSPQGYQENVLSRPIKFIFPNEDITTDRFVQILSDGIEKHKNPPSILKNITENDKTALTKAIRDTLISSEGVDFKDTIEVLYNDEKISIAFDKDSQNLRLSDDA